MPEILLKLTIMSEVLTEITQLSELDCFYIVERHKTEFTYPLHRHREFELNFVEHGAGVRRIVGDSIETVGDYDLVLIGAENLEHVWENGECKSPDIREITIQFSPDFLGSNILEKNQFDSIRKMLKAADHGLAFPVDVIMRVYHYIDTMASESDRFVQFIKFMYILHEMAKGPYKVLSSSSFAHSARNRESRRVTKVKQYINDHYSEALKLDDLAALVGMSPSAFSRFFKMRTGKPLSDYVLDIRLGYAARMLVDSTKNISEICYESGFNNLSNFNRIFKSRRGSTPRDFRALYKKNKIIV